MEKLVRGKNSVDIPAERTGLLLMLSRLIAQLLGGRGKPATIPAEFDAIADAVNRVTAGQQAEREGRLEAALRCYDDGMAQLADSAELRVMRGNVLRGLGRVDEAIEAYRAARALKPALAAAWYNLALTEHELGDAEAAERDYRAAISADPGMSAGYSSLLCLVGMGRPAGDGSAIAPAAVLAEHRRWAAHYAEPLHALRKPLANSRDRLRRSALLDGAGFTRDLGIRYREVWREWCAHAN